MKFLSASFILKASLGCGCVADLTTEPRATQQAVEWEGKVTVSANRVNFLTCVFLKLCF